jgi:hypothetical protein
MSTKLHFSLFCLICLAVSSCMAPIDRIPIDRIAENVSKSCDRTGQTEHLRCTLSADPDTLIKILEGGDIDQLLVLLGDHSLATVLGGSVGTIESLGGLTEIFGGIIGDLGTGNVSLLSSGIADVVIGEKVGGPEIQGHIVATQDSTITISAGRFTGTVTLGIPNHITVSDNSVVTLVGSSFVVTKVGNANCGFAEEVSPGYGRIAATNGVCDLTGILANGDGVTISFEALGTGGVVLQAPTN